TLRAVQAERCTSLYGVPTMFIAELSVPDFADYDLSSLRTGIMAGSPCPVEVMKQVIERMGMTEVGICYGMTETSPVSTQTRADDSLDRRVSTVGRVGPHLEVKVIDPETGRTVPRGTPGELCTRGYSVMIGYWNQPDKTAEAVDAAHWMHTGDLAVMDSEGYLAITGRIKDMVIRGGENIYPREIEEFLYTPVQLAGPAKRRMGAGAPPAPASHPCWMHTAWLPQPRCWGCMSAAFMHYGRAGSGGEDLAPASPARAEGSPSLLAGRLRRY